MSWYNEFDSVFWISISASVLGIGAILIKTAFRSKCRNCKCCFGFVEIERDIEAEIEEHKIEIEHETPSPSSPKNNSKQFKEIIV